MTGNASKLRDLPSRERGATDPHAIRLCEVAGDTRPLSAAPAVLLRHMLGPYLAPTGRDVGGEPCGLGIGATLIEDLRTTPHLSMGRPFHAIDIVIPWVVLDRIADQVGAAPLEGLDIDRRVGLSDPTITHLIGALLPTLRGEGRILQHYVDQLSLALASHIAHVYGRLRPGERRVRGGLAPHILRRAQTMLHADLRAPPPIDELAATCGLSARHFARAFRDSTGLTPHRWMMRARVAAAKSLMQSSPDRLAEIAAACGFADQSHLTRVFKQEAGLSPAAWRRLNASEALPPDTAVSTGRLADRHRVGAPPSTRPPPIALGWPTTSSPPPA